MSTIPKDSSLDHAGVDRRTYEEPNCGSKKPHGQHFHKSIGGLQLNCPGALPDESYGRSAYQAYFMSRDGDLGFWQELNPDQKVHWQEAAIAAIREAGVEPW